MRQVDERVCVCVIVASPRSGPEGAESKARSASFVLPKELADLVRDGMELGDADDQVRETPGP
jgi:non-canonical (house-cleaning) NTP pyrophosphatase